MSPNSGSAPFPEAFLSFSPAACSDRWQEVIFAALQMFLGTTVTAALPTLAAGPGPVGAGFFSGNLKRTGCFVGSAPQEGGVGRLFTGTVSAFNYSQACIRICEEYSRSLEDESCENGTRVGPFEVITGHTSGQPWISWPFYFNNMMSFLEKRADLHRSMWNMWTAFCCVQG